LTCKLLIMTVSVENFVKAIYTQSNISGGITKLSTIAGILNISKAAATDMARKTSLKNLVNYTKYKPLSLTSEGNKLALNVIRKHRLWESFLYKTLDLSLHEIHREAEVLEHLTSDFLTDKIDDFLGNPSVDPHGDPIPTVDGKEKNDESQFQLSEAKEENAYEICRLYGSEKEFFDFCTSNHINIGSKIYVKKQYESNEMTEIKINENILLLNEVFTNVIYVKQLKKKLK
jgi:DtxR family transcriptional regulator, Mn-dependent transcriptional regulator